MKKLGTEKVQGKHRNEQSDSNCALNEKALALEKIQGKYKAKQIDTNGSTNKYWQWENTRKAQNGAHYEKVLPLSYSSFIEQIISFC